MAEVAKALGIELEEPFRIDGKEGYFRLTDTGLGIKRELEDKYWMMAPFDILNNLLIAFYEIIRLSWKPTYGESYYVPDVTSDKKYGIWRWLNVGVDKLHYERGVVFKTAEEAIAVAEQMLAVVKEARDNG